MESEQQFKASLRAAGERITTPRLGIFRLLARYSPLSMAKLIDRGRESGVDPVTTYRTIDLFRRLALVQDLGVGRHRLLELSDTYQAHHHHFTCRRCHAIIDFDNAAVEASLQQVGQELGFSIDSHQLEVTGLCRACRLKG